MMTVFVANKIYRVVIDGKNQTMQVFKDNQLWQTYSVSTGNNGFGEQYGSECTPTGRHQIRAKIGAGVPENTVFVRRRPNGEVYSADYARTQPKDRDWIVTRILWLSGLEPGKNRFGNVDTANRKIYIHGTQDNSLLGRPGSKGCIRMANKDIMDFFEYIPVHTIVDIYE